MSNSVQPCRRQPTRLTHPWDSPGKRTGVGCHFLLQCMKVKSESEVNQLCPTLCNPMDCSQPGSSVHGIFQARVLEWVAIAFSGTYVYLWLIHLYTWQKPTHYCKAIILQSKTNIQIDKRWLFPQLMEQLFVEVHPKSLRFNCEESIYIV